MNPLLVGGAFLLGASVFQRKVPVVVYRDRDGREIDFDQHDEPSPNDVARDRNWDHYRRSCEDAVMLRQVEVEAANPGAWSS